MRFVATSPEALHSPQAYQSMIWPAATGAPARGDQEGRRPGGRHPAWISVVPGGGCLRPGVPLGSGHSLRSVFLTSAAEAGASIWNLSEVSRHKSMDGHVARLCAARRSVQGTRGGGVPVMV
jgi:hypothetical protein